MAIANEPQTTAAPGGRGDGTLGPTTRTGGGDAPQPVTPPDALHIQLDRQDIEVSPDRLHDGALTGQELRELTTPPIGSDRDIFEIVPGGSDRKIEDGDAVAIHDHLRFFSAPRNINPGTVTGLVRSASHRCSSPHQRSAGHAAE